MLERHVKHRQSSYIPKEVPPPLPLTVPRVFGQFGLSALPTSICGRQGSQPLITGGSEDHVHHHKYHHMTIGAGDLGLEGFYGLALLLMKDVVRL